MLSQEVLAAVEARPGELLPDAMWKGLSLEQRAMVQQLRRNLRDGFEPEAAVVERARTTGERREPTPFAGNDPIASVSAAPTPDPTTGLDPVAMHELFGGTVDTAGLEAFEGQQLLDELRRRFFAKHVTLDYREARHVMFTVIDNEGGDVQDVYAGRTIRNVTGIPNPEGPDGFNTEHTWPQSELKEAGKNAAISDLHHLFPVEAFANGKRGHVPFGWVRQVEWQTRDGKSKLGYDEKGQLVFEPPEAHRGNVARALFWVATAYELDIDPDEEAVLREWDKADAIDQKERSRNEAIQKVQGDLNPFVLVPGLADRVKDF